MAIGKKTGGRQKGTLNKATLDIKAAAQKFGAEAVELLVAIASDKDCPPASRVAAIKEILDRGYGKAKQPIVGDDDSPPIQVRAITEVKIIGVRSSGNPDT